MSQDNPTWREIGIAILQLIVSFSIIALFLALGVERINGVELVSSTYVFWHMAICFLILIATDSYK